MPQFFNLQIPPPENWELFEDLCCDLWREIWKDPNAGKNGRKGQNQHGVDIYGRPNQGNTWVGIQCKGKDSYSNKKISKNELNAEVKKAMKFKPRISEFIMATTGKRDARIQKVAREITQGHLKKDLFPVTVWSWEDIIKRLGDYPSIFKKHFPDITLGDHLPQFNREKLIKDNIRDFGKNLELEIQSGKCQRF